MIILHTLPKWLENILVNYDHKKYMKIMVSSKRDYSPYKVEDLNEFEIQMCANFTRDNLTVSIAPFYSKEHPKEAWLKIIEIAKHRGIQVLE